MEKRKRIISDNINSNTPEIPSNRRGLHRAMHFGKKCCSIDKLCCLHQYYFSANLAWFSIEKKPYRIETNARSSISMATFYMFDYKTEILCFAGLWIILNLRGWKDFKNLHRSPFHGVPTLAPGCVPHHCHRQLHLFPRIGNSQVY